MPMSRLGKLPVSVPKGVEIETKASSVVIKGPKGSLSVKIPEFISVKVEDNSIKVVPSKEPGSKFERAMWGTVRSHIANAVRGVTEGWKKELEINGVGYAFKLSGKTLQVACGYSHDVLIAIPDSISCKVEKNILTVEGIDKELVGNFAARIRSIRKPDPYLAKGIKYVGEVIRRKAGKSVKK
jgi:large subunit ribosomal protein L6